MSTKKDLEIQIQEMQEVIRRLSNQLNDAINTVSEFRGEIELLKRGLSELQNSSTKLENRSAAEVQRYE
jgi:predicted  nucleic acid-binding Zn-ribbon protein